MKFDEAVEKYINESSDDKVIIVDKAGTKTLWVTYNPGSGSTAILKSDSQFLTDKKNDEHYNDVVRSIVKIYPINKPIDIPVYDSHSYKEFDIWGGDIKPIKNRYMVISKDKNHYVSFFDNKAEAKAWSKQN